MALVNSLALGKTKGSAGNVTFAVVKGQQVAKQKVPKKGSIAPELLSPSQIRMANFVQAWQFLAVFFAFAYRLAKPTESIYNAVARICKSRMTAVMNEARSLSARDLLLQNSIIGNWGSITGITLPASGSRAVAFDNGGLPYPTGLHVRVLTFQSDTGLNAISDIAVNEAAWLAGTITATGLLSSGEYTAAYLYTTDKSKISNVFCAED